MAPKNLYTVSVKVLSPLTHGLVLVTAVVLAYLFEKIPGINNFALQAVAVALLAFFLIKYLGHKTTRLTLIPRYATLELAIITFGLLLCIGATGNLASPIFFLAYLHLFIIVLSTYPESAIVTGMAVVWYHYALSPQTAMSDISSLLSLPVMLAIFLYAKSEHEKSVRENTLRSMEEQRVNQLQNTIQAQAEKIESLDPTSV